MNVQDQAVRSRALAPNQSFIVQAPAGSGKTELLTQRFLTLLLHVPQAPEEVLAITFTRKAASEMRQRIVESLERAATQPQPADEPAATNWAIARAVLARDAEMNWQLTESPNRLRILTIDGFCHSLVRQMPLLSELGAIPTVTEESSRLYQMAAAQTLAPIQSAQSESISGSMLVDSLKTVLGHLDNQLDRLQQLIASMLARRDQWLGHIAPYFGRAEMLRDQLQMALEVIVEQILAAQISAIDALAAEPKVAIDLRSAEPLLHYAAEQLRAQLSPDAFEQHRFSAAFHGEALEPLRFWQAMAHLLTTQSSGKVAWRKSRGVNKSLGFVSPASLKDREQAETAKVNKERLGLLLDALHECAERPVVEAALQALGEISRLPSEPYREQQWRVIEALITLLIHSVGELKLVFQLEGQVDFNEVSMAALRALGDEESPSDLALKLDYRIQHILIDEFQDTSISQFDLLRGLTRGWEHNDGRTLFLVGDPMQSIYRFREADVSLFLKARNEGVGEVGLEFLQLKTNFRSDPEVIHWVNRIFQQVMPQSDNVVTGAVSYSDSAPGRPPSGREEAGVSVHVALSDDQQIDQLISQIVQYRQGAPDASVAVLIRARTHATDLIRKLRRANLAYQAIEIDALAQKPLIIDLLTLTKAIYFGSDAIAWLSLLRAPWCGLSLHDLHEIVHFKPERLSEALSISEGDVAEETVAQGSIGEALIWENCLGIELSALSDEGAIRLQYLRRVMAPLLQKRRRYPVRETVEAAWQALGGAYYTAAEDLDDAERYFQLLESIDQGWDIVDIEQLSEKVERLFAQPKVVEQNPIQIMTIHKSKGLEFDAVFIPHLEKSGRHDDASLLSWLRQEHPHGERDLLLFAPIKDSYGQGDLIYDFIRKLEREKGAHELGRLFYVAATRAKRSLFLSATVTPDAEEGSASGATGTEVAKVAKVAKVAESAPLLQLKNVKQGSLFSMVLDSAIDLVEIERQLNEQRDDQSVGSRVDVEASTTASADLEPNADIYRLPSSFYTAALNSVKKGVEEKEGEKEGEKEAANIEEGLEKGLEDVGMVSLGSGSKLKVIRADLANNEAEASGWQRVVGTVLHRLLEGLEEGFQLPQTVNTRFWALMLQKHGLPLNRMSEALELLEQSLHNIADDERAQWILKKRAICFNEYPLTVLRSGGEIARCRVDRLFIDEGDGTLWIIDYKLAQPRDGERHDAFMLRQRRTYQQQLDSYADAAGQIFDVQRVKLGLYLPLSKAWCSWEPVLEAHT